MNVVITGTDKGLGLKLMCLFHEHDHTVFGSRYTNATQGSSAYDLDLASITSVTNYARTIRDSCAKIDLLIHNAAINRLQPFEQMYSDDLDRMMMVNFIAPVMLTQALLPLLRDGGRVLHISSDAAVRPMRHTLGYNCSKAALDMATRQMARELSKPYGLSIVSVRPGRFSGDMSQYVDDRVCTIRGWTREHTQQYWQDAQNVHHEAPVGDVAQMIYDLATSPLFPQMSGACIDLVG